LYQSNEIEQIIRRNVDIANIKILIQELKSIEIDENWMLELKKSFCYYRIVSGNYNPLSTAGALSCGGRFNIGAAQVISTFEEFSQQAALYLSCDLETAKKEYNTTGLPLSLHDKFYEIKCKNKLNVFNLTIVLEELDKKMNPFFKPLSHLIIDIPMVKAWKYQKYPLLSQILGTWLRKNSGNKVDGIIWPSVRNLSGKNLVLFFQDDAHAEKCLTASLIK